GRVSYSTAMRAERGASPVAARLRASASVLACGGVSLDATGWQRIRWNTIQPRAVSWCGRAT
ncbi:MAG TPA: hypothetical protein VF502_07035, partial [Stellaceae bacterium]